MKKEKDNEKAVKTHKGRGGDGLFFDKNKKLWGFRITDDKDYRRVKWQTKTEAKKAKRDFELELEQRKQEAAKEEVITLEKVYKHYLEHGALEKRDGTLAKQDSMWRNHISAIYGSRAVDSFSSGEINNYLLELYMQGDGYGNRKGGYAYGYVEGFLKFFYLLFGYSRRQNWIDKEKHRDLCVDKDSKIRMPKKTQEDLADEGEIETYTLDEINRMRERINLKNSNLALSFEIGYFMGLRISECFGLMWEDINFETKIMKIERQLVKPKGCKFWCLAPLKTPAAYREIDIPDQLLTLLKERKEQQEKDALEYGEAYKNKEVVKKRLLKGQDESLVGGSFINRAPDGSLFTSDSMKSWATKFEAELGIHFKYHNLRHTHASTLAALNCPIPLLTKRLGHEKIETTQQYYFGKNEISQEKLISGLNSL